MYFLGCENRDLEREAGILCHRLPPLENERQTLFLTHYQEQQ